MTFVVRTGLVGWLGVRVAAVGAGAGDGLGAGGLGRGGEWPAADGASDEDEGEQHDGGGGRPSRGAADDEVGLGRHFLGNEDEAHAAAGENLGGPEEGESREEPAAEIQAVNDAWGDFVGDESDEGASFEDATEEDGDGDEVADGVAKQEGGIAIEGDADGGGDGGDGEGEDGEGTEGAGVSVEPVDEDHGEEGGGDGGLGTGDGAQADVEDDG